MSQSSMQKSVSIQLSKRYVITSKGGSNIFDNPQYLSDEQAIFSNKIKEQYKYLQPEQDENQLFGGDNEEKQITKDEKIQEFQIQTENQKELNIFNNLANIRDRTDKQDCQLSQQQQNQQNHIDDSLAQQLKYLKDQQQNLSDLSNIQKEKSYEQQEQDNSKEQEQKYKKNYFLNNKSSQGSQDKNKNSSDFFINKEKIFMGYPLRLFVDSHRRFYGQAISEALSFNGLICLFKNVDQFDKYGIPLFIKGEQNRLNIQDDLDDQLSVQSNQSSSFYYESNSNQFLEESFSGKNQKVQLQTMKKRVFNQWIPLYINEQHFNENEKQIKFQLEKLYKILDFDGQFSAEIIFKLLPPLLVKQTMQIAIKFIKMTKNYVQQQNEDDIVNQIQAFLQIFKLFYELSKRYYDIGHQIFLEKQEKFEKNDQSRSKGQLGDLGEFQFIAQVYDEKYLNGDKFKENYMRETTARAVKWISEDREKQIINRKIIKPESINKEVQLHFTLWEKNRTFQIITSQLLNYFGRHNFLNLLDRCYCILDKDLLKQFIKHVRGIKVNIENYQDFFQFQYGKKMNKWEVIEFLQQSYEISNKQNYTDNLILPKYIQYKKNIENNHFNQKKPHQQKVYGNTGDNLQNYSQQQYLQRKQPNYFKKQQPIRRVYGNTDDTVQATNQEQKQQQLVAKLNDSKQNNIKKDYGNIQNSQVFTNNNQKQRKTSYNQNQMTINQSKNNMKQSGEHGDNKNRYNKYQNAQQNHYYNNRDIQKQRQKDFKQKYNNGFGILGEKYDQDFPTLNPDKQQLIQTPDFQNEQQCEYAKQINHQQQNIQQNQTPFIQEQNYEQNDEPKFISQEEKDKEPVKNYLEFNQKDDNDNDQNQSEENKNQCEDSKNQCESSENQIKSQNPNQDGFIQPLDESDIQQSFLSVNKNDNNINYQYNQQVQSGIQPIEESQNSCNFQESQEIKEQIQYNQQQTDNIKDDIMNQQKSQIQSQQQQDYELYQQYNIMQQQNEKKNQIYQSNDNDHILPQSEDDSESSENDNQV
ncbi:hypothetical protein PPERSA_01283 [Pseudocohnilembus persalinus]|uniref:Uncharacterized protein n=1 Tax=Pseudocohnilembus persalinus TaxID=266149 RepID=A0A0V0QGV7_PSEPJ|nr:hypothetical protein PPERSA_01283 [Pseudocohnilembus persalinus]|eukprot:KRX01380.1 hypothetical protein PPERSA_01283 [Pseudocohnilembus persalinus]